MNWIKPHNLACPIDGKRLESNEKQLICESGHTFDIARQGYMNLLPVQHKRSRQPGDSKEMVAARTGFLNSGVYEPIAKLMTETIFAQIAEDAVIANQDICLLDAGCGDGYYSDFVFNALINKTDERSFSLIGLDISKDAIVQCAKRNKQMGWIVGTNRSPPLEHASVDIILCIFGFQSFEGFDQILKSGGKVILVDPGPDHLKELREIIYTEVKKAAPQSLPFVEEKGFTLTGCQPLRFNTGIINNQQINDLLLMTPHLFRATKEGKEAAGKLEQLDLTVDVVFRVLEKA